MDILPSKPTSGKYSDEWHKQQSERAKARWANPEHRAKMLQRKAEAFATPEVKERISQAQKRRFNDPAKVKENAAFQEKRREALRTPEYREKRSKAAKERLADPERREALSARAKEAMNRPEVKQKCSEARKASHSRPEVKENISRAQKKRFERPEEREKTSQKTKAAMASIINTEGYKAALAAGMSKVHRKKGPTDIERIVEALLQSLNMEYEAQKQVGHWVADFCVPSHNLIVECDGEYWHSSEQAKARDARKDAYLTEKGYKVIRLTGSDIHAKKFDPLLAALGF